MKKWLSLSLLVLLSIAISTLYAQGRSAPNKATAKQDLDGDLIKETRITLEKMKTTRLEISVEEGMTLADVIKRVCDMAELEIGSTVNLGGDYGEDELGLGMIRGRVIDILHELKGDRGLEWRVMGPTIWFDAGEMIGEDIVRSYDISDIQEFLDRRQQLLSKTMKKKAPSTNENEAEEGEEIKRVARSEDVDVETRASEELISAIYDLLVYRDSDEDGAATFGGVVSVRTSPERHVAIEDYLASLRKTLNLR